MAKVKTWKTKADVLRDIAEATGTVQKKDIAAQFIVVGDAPPPPLLMEDEDSDMNLMFGDCYRRLSQSENTGPDLAGIRQMLDLVRNFERDDDEDSGCIEEQLKYEITISKGTTDRSLNPNVPEFVPNVGKTETSVISVLQSASACVETREKVFDCGDSNNVTDTGTQATRYDEDVTTALKNTISKAAKSDSQSYHLKKQKNVAIATLLRLYANNDTNSKPDVKLWTPEQFEKTKDGSSDVKVEESYASDYVTPKALPVTPIEPIRRPDSIEGDNPKRALVQDPEIRESIAKVNRWLAAPVQEKLPKTPYLGPICFKRKDPVKPSTSSKSASPQPSTATSKSESPSTTIKLFQPSKYAADLGKQYRDRCEQKQKDAEQTVNWDNLSDVLKQKDLAAKKRLAEQMSPSTSNADT